MRSSSQWFLAHIMFFFLCPAPAEGAIHFHISSLFLDSLGKIWSLKQVFVAQLQRKLDDATPVAPPTPIVLVLLATSCSNIRQTFCDPNQNWETMDAWRRSIVWEAVSQLVDWSGEIYAVCFSSSRRVSLSSTSCMRPRGARLTVQEEEEPLRRLWRRPRRFWPTAGSWRCLHTETWAPHTDLPALETQVRDPFRNIKLRHKMSSEFICSWCFNLKSLHMKPLWSTSLPVFLLAAHEVNHPTV